MNTFLNSIANGHAVPARLDHPATQKATPKAHVDTNVQPMAAQLLGRPAPPPTSPPPPSTAPSVPPVPTLTSGLPVAVRRGTRAAAAMVVGVHVEDEEPTLGRQPVQMSGEPGVERVTNCTTLLLELIGLQLAFFHTFRPNASSGTRYTAD